MTVELGCSNRFCTLCTEIPILHHRLGGPFERVCEGVEETGRKI